MRNGITVAGSVIVDKIYQIPTYPALGELIQIASIEPAMGGCVANVAMDLKKICPDMPIRAVGLVGTDSEAEFYKNTLVDAGVDTAGIRQIGGLTTCTHVMSIPGGQRTFFTYAGADGELTAQDIDFAGMESKILHLGYFLLLKKVDAGEGLTILQKAKEAGLETSIDLVSESSDRYGLVLPCLPYTDYLIINELEAGKLAGIDPTCENLEAICRKLMHLGVKKKVIIHMPERAVCLSEAGFTQVGSYILPDGFIQGTTGAGDAFCAGSLVGIYKGWEDRNILEFASGCAVMSLRCAGATGGLAEEREINDFCKQFPRREG